jgi:hypothetical protein
MEQFIMFRTSWFPWRSHRQRQGWSRPLRSSRVGRHATRLTLERLEDRTLLSNFTAASVSDLIADINAANSAGGLNTITLTASRTSPYVLSKVDNTIDGPTGLPVIAAGDTLTIIGNGDTIERNTKSGTPAFRLLDVASGASLTLENLTVENGLAFGSGSSAEGGGIFNQGTLVLNGVILQANTAQGSAGADGTKSSPCGQAGSAAAGGGIWSNDSLTLENSTQILNNVVLGGNGGNAYQKSTGNEGGDGGPAYGGGIAVASGTINLSGTTLFSNSVGGGSGGLGSGRNGFGGAGNGGGLYFAGTTAGLTGGSVQKNTASNVGAGLWISGGTANLSSDSVDSNSGESGFDVSGGNVSLSSCTVNSNAGYGLQVEGGSVSLSSCTVDSNGSGGLFVFAFGSLSLSGVTVDSNTAMGLWVRGGSVSLSNSTVDSNLGGGLRVDGGIVSLSSDIVEFNGAGVADGGGLDVDGGTVNLSSVTVDYNSASQEGGGLWVVGGIVSLCNVTVQFNTAGSSVYGFGGGIFIGPVGTLYIDSFTVANTINNTDSSGTNGSTANIDGTYILRNC